MCHDIDTRYNLFYNGEQIYESLNFIPATLYTLTVQKNGNRTVNTIDILIWEGRGVF